MSDIAGTTTDPVEKAAELAPIGPVVYIDTAGIDDVGELGQLRVERTLSVLGWMDIALIVCSSQQVTDYELGLMKLAAQNKTPAIVVFNKADLGAPEDFVLAIAKKHNLPYVVISAKEKEGIDALREAIDELPEREKMTILLRFFKGLTQEQAARLLGVSQVQVSRLERRALEKLRASLSDEL